MSTIEMKEDLEEENDDEGIHLPINSSIGVNTQRHKNEIKMKK
jgi:hypothetical protein